VQTAQQTSYDFVYIFNDIPPLCTNQTPLKKICKSLFKFHLFFVFSFYFSHCSVWSSHFKTCLRFLPHHRWPGSFMISILNFHFIIFSSQSFYFIYILPAKNSNLDRPRCTNISHFCTIQAILDHHIIRTSHINKPSYIIFTLPHFVQPQ
jgi:hypothetical protein